jgi:hypothetical protein
MMVLLYVSVPAYCLDLTLSARILSTAIAVVLFAYTARLRTVNAFKDWMAMPPEADAIE